MQDIVFDSPAILDRVIGHMREMGIAHEEMGPILARIAPVDLDLLAECTARLADAPSPRPPCAM